MNFLHTHRWVLKKYCCNFLCKKYNTYKSSVLPGIRSHWSTTKFRGLMNGVSALHRHAAGLRRCCGNPIPKKKKNVNKILHLKCKHVQWLFSLHNAIFYRSSLVLPGVKGHRFITKFRRLMYGVSALQRLTAGFWRCCSPSLLFFHSYQKITMCQP